MEDKTSSKELRNSFEDTPTQNLVISSLVESKTKGLILRVFVNEYPLTIKKLHNILKNRHRSDVTENNVRKIVYWLVDRKVLTKKDHEYYLSVDFFDKLKLIGEKMKKSYVKRSMVDFGFKERIEG